MIRSEEEVQQKYDAFKEVRQLTERMHALAEEEMSAGLTAVMETFDVVFRWVLGDDTAIAVDESHIPALRSAVEGLETLMKE